jgi:hypothetical protein
MPSVASTTNAAQASVLPSEVIAAAKSHRLFPLQPRSKEPFHGFKWQSRASSDVGCLTAWAREYPGCNWALVLGERDAVIDVDGEEGQAALAELEKHGFIFTETITVETGRHPGQHRYYLLPADVKIRSNNTGKIAPHIDVKTEGGYVVWPPSTHPNGNLYSLGSKTRTVAVLPAWALERLNAEPSRNPGRPGPTDKKTVSKGSRTNYLVSLAGSMHRRHMDPGAIEAALLVENRLALDPALDEAKVRAIARDIPARYPNPKSQPKATPKTRPELVCLADVKPLPVPWLWGRYLAFGMLSMLSGDPSSGKTFIALAIAAELSNGRIPVTGESCEPISTLYLSHENAAEYVIRPRFDAQGGNPKRFFLLRGSIEGEDEDATRAGITLTDVAILEAALIQTGAKLIIIDPIQSYLGAEIDAHRSNETRPVMDGLIALAETHDVCVLIVRHLAKASGGRAIHRGLGSIDLTGAVRTEMLAGTAPEEPDNRALVQIKNNLGPQAGSLGYEITGEEMEARLEWRGSSTLTAADLLAPDAAGEDRSDIAEAEDYIREQLALGPKLLRDLKSASGIPEWTLQRAARKVGITRSRAGERGPWIWTLDDHTRQKSAYPTTNSVVAYGRNGRLCSDEPAKGVPETDREEEWLS